MSPSGIDLTDANAWGRRMGGAGYAVLAAIMAFGPWLASRAWPSTPDELAAEGVRTRITVGADLLECRPSEDWTGLAAAVARLRGEPTWEEMRRLMEERGCRGLRYVLRVRYHLDDGATDELSYIRRPYDDPHLLGEFLRALGRADELAAADGDRPIASLDLRSSLTRSTRSLQWELLESTSAAAD